MKICFLKFAYCASQHGPAVCTALTRVPSPLHQAQNTGQFPQARPLAAPWPSPILSAKGSPSCSGPQPRHAKTQVPSARPSSSVSRLHGPVRTQRLPISCARRPAVRWRMDGSEGLVGPSRCAVMNICCDAMRSLGRSEQGLYPGSLCLARVPAQGTWCLPVR